jgi:hypothetical protein
VPLAVTASGIVRREFLDEVIVKLIGHDRGEPARACQGGFFLVNPAVFPAHVIRGEYLEQVIGE